jgi:putative phage-type endonuclease
VTPELRQKRAGKLTASKAAVIMGGLDTSGLDLYIKDLAWERVYGPVEEGYRNDAMDRGKAMESVALDWYAFETDSVLDRDPDRTVDHPLLGMVAATPDALRDDRVVEAKSPLHRAWMETARTDKVPSEYRWQCRWQMWCTGFSLCDFIAYHPQGGGLIVPIEIEKSEIAEMAARVEIIEERIAKWVAILNNRKES